MILVGHPHEIREVEEVGPDHLVNCKNNTDYVVINTENGTFFNPITDAWEKFVVR